MQRLDSPKCRGSGSQWPSNLACAGSLPEEHFSHMIVSILVPREFTKISGCAFTSTVDGNLGQLYVDLIVLVAIMRAPENLIKKLSFCDKRSKSKENLIICHLDLVLCFYLYPGQPLRLRQCRDAGLSQ